MARMGDQIARQYRLDKELNVQATHTLFLAHDLFSSHDVLIRVFPKNQVVDPDGLQRACKKLYDLNHGELEAPLAFGQLDDGDIYIVTPASQGVAFNEIIPKDEGLPINDVWPLLQQISDALALAHECGLYHLELTPQEIRVVSDAEKNESVIIAGLGFRPFLKSYSSIENRSSSDANAFARIINFALLGHKGDQKESFATVRAVLDAYSEKHRAAILVHTDESEMETPPESLTEFSLGRFLIACVVVTLMGGTVLLYFWLSSNS